MPVKPIIMLMGEHNATYAMTAVTSLGADSHKSFRRVGLSNTDCLARQRRTSKRRDVISALAVVPGHERE